ncbi:MAG: nodulation protein NfeD [Acidobacteria bacterium]|nr:nodulation protein NfeD [Acidobacteriota bacterium]
MKVPRHSALFGVLLITSGSVLMAAAQPAPPAPPIVFIAQVDAVIHPVSAEYMIQTMDAADAAGASLVVFMLQTPGGLVDSTRDIVTRMLSAKTPVAVFVGPAGSRAASAGFILTIAADIAAMAPGTHIGAAHPVAGGGESMDATTSEKAAQDVAAYTRTLATGRRRNVALAEAAVTQSRAFTEREAADATPPLIDLIASDLPDLLRRLDGRTITRFDGRVVILRTAGAELRTGEMTFRQRVLSAIAHPNIAYILLSLGMLGLTIELWTPGAVLPGVVGGVSLLLAFFALRLLPVNYAGVLLIMLGLLLLILEIKVTSYGLLAAGGIVSLGFGAMILMDPRAPELQLSLRVVGPVVLASVVVALFLVRLAVAAQRQAPVTGAAGMIGVVGHAITTLEPNGIGQVRAQGEIWQATTAEDIAEGTPVRVTHIEGLTLTVRKV